MGIPIVELGDDKWHVNVMQKVPLSRDRDNVNPAYLRKIRVGVLNAKFADIGENDATATWVKEAMSSSKSTDEAVKHVFKERFGTNAVIRDVTDVGSTKEAVCQGYDVVEGGSMSKEEWARVKAIKKEDGTSYIKTTAQVAPTNFTSGLTADDYIDPKDWTAEMQAYARVIESLAPKLINKPVVAKFIDDPDCYIQGCFHKAEEKLGRKVKREFGVMVVNLFYHDCSSAKQNYFLLLHEFAHNELYSNDHLAKTFYDEVTTLGAKLAILALKEPELFELVEPTDEESEVQPLWDAAPDVYPVPYGEGAAA